MPVKGVLSAIKALSDKMMALSFIPMPYFYRQYSIGFYNQKSILSLSRILRWLRPSITGSA